MSMTLPLPTAQTSTSNGCRLVAADGRELPLRSVVLSSEAGGGLARTVVRQVFANPFDKPLAVTYQLPLPADGAVIDFAFTLGDRRIAGRVEKKADARAAFEQALVEGRTAALLEQDRSSLFHQELGNVPAGAEITCEITIEHLLSWRAGGWEWRFPTVVAPRFMGPEGQTPDADRVSVDVLDGEAPVRCALELAIADRCTTAPSSPSHVVTNQDGTWSFGADARLDRDVVVRWSSSDRAIRPDVQVVREGAEAYALLSLVPPVPDAQPEPVARDLILLLDISGSMGGRPIEQLKAFSRALVKTLGPADQLEMIGFASQQQHWSNGPVSMTPRAQAEALDWLENLRAGGGTYMHDAIIAALKPLRTDAQRQVVLVTDGLIGFEQQIIGAIRNELPAGSRVHSIGVGSGVNRSLTGPSARAGAGLEIVVGLDESVDSAVADLLARTDAPLVVELSVRGSVLREVAPMRVPDLFANAPTRLWLQVDPKGGPLQVSGKTAAGPWSTTIHIPSESTGTRAVATRFARERIEDLELALAAGGNAGEIDASIEALALKHQIASRLTSWVAETQETTVDPSDPTAKVAVPQNLPYGMSAEGVGLRQAPQFPGLGSAVAAGAPAPQMAMPKRRVRKAKRGPAPAAPPAPKAEAAEERKGGGLFERAASAIDGLFGGRRDEPAPEPEGASAPMELEAEESLDLADDEPTPGFAPAAFRATIRSLRDGTLILEITVDRAAVWEIGEFVSLELPDGSFATVEVKKGTTRNGAVSAGDAIRLVLAWDGARPVHARAGSWELTIS